MTALLQDLVLLFSRQRSGTNALQGVLATHPEIHCTREVFHPEPETQAHLDPELSFFRFLGDRGHPGTRRTTRSQEEVFLAFMGMLRERAHGRIVVIDVKLNSTHHFDGPWRPLIGWPELFHLALRHRMRVLHLVRANGLRTAVSHIKARQTQRWVVRGEQPPEDFAVTVPTDALLPALYGARSEDALVRGAFQASGRYRCVEYATLFRDLATGFGDLAAWFGVDPDFRFAAVDDRKQASLPLESTIENFDKVRAVLTGTPFEHCLVDESLQ